MSTHIYIGKCGVHPSHTLLERTHGNGVGMSCKQTVLCKETVLSALNLTNINSRHIYYEAVYLSKNAPIGFIIVEMIPYLKG